VGSGIASPFAMFEPVLVYEGYDGQTWSDGTTAIDFQANGKVRVRPYSAQPITPSIQPTGVNQVALVQSIQTAASGLVAGAITQAQIDALKAAVNQLMPDAVSAPAVSVPPAASLTDSTGTVWSLGSVTPYGKAILRNGVPPPVGGQASLLTFKNGQLYVQNTALDWFQWLNSDWRYLGKTAP
jgi:hypothetical protein